VETPVRTILLVAAGAVLASAARGAGSTVDESAFRYVRPIERQGTGPAIVEPDARLFAHSLPGFADLRIVTRAGAQVPWRPMPEAPAVETMRLAVVYRGTQDGKAVVLLDSGARRPTLDELELDIPATGFVGRAEVLGGDDRRTFTELSSTVVYDISGAKTARSTTAVFPASSPRYYLVRVSGVPAVMGATASIAADRARRVVKPAVKSEKISPRSRRTVVTIDLGFRRVPVDRLRITATTPVYDRAVDIEESENGRLWRWAASGRAFRLPDSIAQEMDVSTSSRYVRVVIANGDDAPLTGITVTPVADSRAILVRGGTPGPLRLLYGNRTLGPPQYDFELLPMSAIDLENARPASLGTERRVPASIQAPAPASFFERHGWAVPALLALAAIGIGAVGLAAALKPRRPTGPAV
jgi:hypothetical protein